MKWVLFLFILWATNPSEVEKKPIKNFETYEDCITGAKRIQEALINKKIPPYIVNSEDIKGYILIGVCEQELDT